MTIQELKENLLSIGVNNYYKNEIDEIFAEYEQSQKAETFEKELEKIVKEETVIKKHITIEEIKTVYKDLHGIFDKKYMEEIEGMKKEIEYLKKEISKSINLGAVEIKREEPKQERFCFMPYHNSDKFHIIDKNHDYIHDGLFSKHQAEETCRILNSLEKSK